MSPFQIILLIVFLAMFVGLPLWGVYALWKWLNTDPKDRPERQGGGGYMSNAIGGAMLELDKLTRPSVEHTIEAQSHVVEEDEHDGE